MIPMLLASPESDETALEIVRYAPQQECCYARDIELNAPGAGFGSLHHDKGRQPLRFHFLGSESELVEIMSAYQLIPQQEHDELIVSETREALRAKLLEHKYSEKAIDEICRSWETSYVQDLAVPFRRLMDERLV